MRIFYFIKSNYFNRRTNQKVAQKIPTTVTDTADKGMNPKQLVGNIT